MLDEIKSLGFRMQRAAVSRSASMTWSSGQQATLVRTPTNWSSRFNNSTDGAITNGERYNKVIESGRPLRKSCR